ncbi:hypothetical protein J2J97_32345 (plasmid) [Rhizobium bangladeshense]|uniref:hypothetical protein n=1 Tax=Rhizobium bangladeshense TaxID=1138189 RepID=UPI001A99BB2B|nr:hypothetical protein [Rhizobium bangladeshense]QSY98596.1 hypothetical protein J2J97_32345 [Rhizobium bangladeshense]
MSVTPLEQEPRRAIVLHEDEPVRDERDKMLDLTKRELIIMIEALELQNGRFKEYMAAYEQIQVQDREEKHNLRTAGVALKNKIEEMERTMVDRTDARFLFRNLVYSALQIVHVLPENMRTQPAMTAIRHIEHQIYKTTFVLRWSVEDMDLACAIWQLCKWACYKPREKSNLYQPWERADESCASLMIDHILKDRKL